MAIKFQYNKTSLQSLEKQLKVRVRALPTLISKESALRVEVKKSKDESKQLDSELSKTIESYDNMVALWCEFDTSLIKVSDVKLGVKKIAGVKTPVLESIEFDEVEFSVFNKPKWYLNGVAILKKMAEIAIRREVFEKKMQLLEYGRKKTTQKVNLFEKVQIPGYEDAVKK